MKIDITGILEAVIALAAAVVTGIIVPYIKSRTSREEQKEIMEWVRLAVSAAEQIYAGNGRGREKKAYVLAWLETHGLTLDSEALDAVIEAAVYELKSGGEVA